MNDFYKYDVTSKLSPGLLLSEAKRVFPYFNWRQGDSDLQGPYITGTSGDSVQMKLWLAEAQIAMSVSFRSAWLENPQREHMKKQILDDVLQKFIPAIGTMADSDR